MTRAISRNTFSLGFTLVELLVVIVLFSIVATIAIPNFAPLVANNRVTAAANDLLGTLQYARSEAVKLNTPVSVSSDPVWSVGWVVERDETPLRQQTARARVEIEEADGNDVIIFGTAGNAIPDAFFTIRATGNANAIRCLRLTASGATLVTGDCGASS